MVSVRRLLIAAMLTLAASAAWAQPFEFTGVWNPALTESAQRRDDRSYRGLVFDYESAKQTDGGTPNGNLKSNQVSQNPFLSTLPGNGNGQTLVTLGPCAGNTVHAHPRGSEISFVTSGELLFGMIEENMPAGANAPILRNLKVGQTIHIPQGLLHFSHNPTCFPAQFLASFGTADPGTQTTWTSFIAVPDAVLHMSTGIPEATFRRLRQTFPLVIAPGTGGEECLARCGLNFTQSNAFFPPPVLPAPGAYGAPPLGGYTRIPPGYGIDFLAGGQYASPSDVLPHYGAMPSVGQYPAPGGPGSPGNAAVVTPLPDVLPPIVPPPPLMPLNGPTLAPTAVPTAMPATPTSGVIAVSGPGGPGTSTSATGNGAAQASNGGGDFSSSTGAPSAGGNAAAGLLQNPLGLLG